MKSLSLLEQTNYGKHLVQMVVKPSRLTVIGQDCEELLKSASPTWSIVDFDTLK